MLKEISIRVYKDEKRPIFQFYTGGIEELYFLNLGKVNINNIKFINLFFTNQDYCVTAQSNSQIDANITFDFFAFDKLTSNFLKKKAILDTLHSGMLMLGQEFGWDINLFELSYSKCIEKNLSYSWLFKGRLFRSPNKKYYFALLHILDVGNYEIWEILFDENKNEISRRICFKDKFRSFFVDFGSWDDQSKIFFYSFKGPQKKFIAIIDDLISRKEIDVNIDTSTFFKG